MNSKVRFLSVGAALAWMSVAWANPISPEQALKRLQSESRRVESSSKSSFVLKETFSKDSEPTLYIFSKDNQTLILSADDELPAVLGYTDSSYMADELPDGFKAWLETLSAETNAIRNGEAKISSARSRATDFATIAPKCKTKWGQDAPYNNMCPKVTGSDKRTVTGCIATAMAQVMKYHNWPDRGEGRLMYTMNGKSMLLRLGDPYIWSSMLDTYSENEYTEEEANAVAFLMKSCGYSVEMEYSSSSSGSVSPLIAAALGKNFKYDKSKLRYMMRDYFSLEEWEEMVYRSLSIYGPVILDGQSNQGGHCFVCDGYDKNGFFHINWGWKGLSDGYFLLSVLDPFQQGIGGSGDNSGFNFMQDAVLGITPAKNVSGETPNGDELWIGTLFSAGPMGLDTSKVYSKGDYTDPLCAAGIYNYGPTPLPAETAMGLIFRNDKGEVFALAGELGVEVNILYGFKELEMPLPEEIPDGSYRVTLSYGIPGENEEDMEWHDTYFPVRTPAAYTAEVKGNEIRFKDSSWRPSRVEEISPAADGSRRYFNLQGMELQSPQSGEITIVVENGKVTKKLF